MVLALAALLLVMAAGVAVAVTKTCSGNPCYGTNTRDVLYERANNGLADDIIGRDGGDTIDANGWDNDTDILRGGRGNDVLYGNDGDGGLTGDKAIGGQGANDRCVVDVASEAAAGSCEHVIVDPAGTQSV